MRRGIDTEGLYEAQFDACRVTRENGVPHETHSQVWRSYAGKGLCYLRTRSFGVQ